ncbi:MAG: arginine--tRNA ligase [Bacteroidota bacterium]
MKEYLLKEITQTLNELGFGAIEIILEKTKIVAHGDLSCNVALQLAKNLKSNPREVANKILQNLKLDKNKIEKIEIAGPGFINFTFTKSFIIEESKKIISNLNNFGKSDFGKNKKVNIEWVSANPTGPLHSGHGRQVVLGATIANILEWCGFEVTREYYFNNAGNQMRMLSQSVLARYGEICGKNFPFPEKGYNGNYIKIIAKELFEKYGDKLNDNETDLTTIKKYAETWCFENIKNSLHKLKVYHDVFYNEDSLYETGKIKEVIEEFRNKNLAYDKDGAIWFKTSSLGMEQDRVIVKSSGEPTYRLPDIAYHREKFRRGYDLILDIFGADHIATIPDVIKGIEALGLDSNKMKIIIHQMVSFVEADEVVKMSKRNANVYTLDDLIEEVGTDAVHYFFVMRSANTHLEFDIALAKKQSEQNPVYYVQYAHARIASILRFAESEGIENDLQKNLQSLNKLETSEEINILKTLLNFPEIISNCAKSFEPHHLTNYLKEVAEAFHSFYHANRVLNDDEELTRARITLCLMAKKVLANGLEILNVSAPEKM